MVGEYSRFPTSSLLWSAVLSGIYRATHLDIEYLRHCSVDFNFDLINEKIWNNNWVITKITGNILPVILVITQLLFQIFSFIKSKLKSTEQCLKYSISKCVAL